MTPITGHEIYQRTSAYEREASGIRLHAPQWKLLLAFDGNRTVAELAPGAGFPLPEAVKLTETFLKREWIAEQPITLEQYLKRASASGNFSGGVIPPSVVLNEPKVERKLESATPPPIPSQLPVAPAVSPVPRVPALVPSALSPATSFAPAVTASAAAAPAPSRALSSRGPMRLSAVVSDIVSSAENMALGQLFAYRVFLRVPPEVLQSEDIVSIHLVDDTSLVRTEGLQKAISAAVMEVLKRPLPDSVYAPA